MKRKRNHIKFNEEDDDLDGFLVDDSDNEISNDNILPLVKRRKLTETDKKIISVRDTIKDRDITYEKIISLDLPEDDLIWFVEHLDILEHTCKYTEDHYRMKMLIYNKFKEIEKSNIKKDVVEKLKNIANLTNDILTKIFESTHNDYIKAILYKKFKSVEELDKTDEYFKVIEWIDTILEIPTEIKKINNQNIGESLLNLRDTLNTKLFGLEHVKERIIETSCAMMNNPFYKKKFLALVGPPGVGKTALAQAVAESMDLPFSQISFGSMKDASVLTGHSATYIGAKPGLFTNILKKNKILNGVVLLDELDKIPNTAEGQSINSVLLHVLDFSQNNRFQYMYMPEICLDLSNIFFILALNDVKLLDHILRDRIHVVKINGYSLEEKISIVNEFILPKILKNLSFNNGDISFTKSSIIYLISKIHNNEYGVRNLEKTISTICEKINVLRHIKNKKIKMSYNIENLKFPLILTEKYIDNLF